MPQTILIVGVEPHQMPVLRDHLVRSGYQVTTAVDGAETLDQVRREPPDLILLDLDQLGPAGQAVARRVWAVRFVPIIMMTAQVAEANRLLGVELGAESYLLKPFSPHALMARINQAGWWRAQAPEVIPDVIQAADLLIDVGRRTILRGATPIEVTPTGFKLLAAMARAPGRVFTRRQLLEITRGDEPDRGERIVDAHIRNLRAKLEADPRRPRYLVTVNGVGYIFNDA